MKTYTIYTRRDGTHVQWDEAFGWVDVEPPPKKEYRGCAKDADVEPLEVVPLPPEPLRGPQWWRDSHPDRVEPYCEACGGPCRDESPKEEG